MDYFKKTKETIAPALAGYLEAKKTGFSHLPPWGPDVITRLAEFSQNGKLIRGGLALLGHEMYGGTRPEAALAMELFQSGFLIHDDIMDRDRLRRGKPSFFMQYARLAETDDLADPYHQGESLGICGGDIALFLGFDLLSRSAPPAPYIGFCTREIIGVGMAQMQDVWFGASPRIPRVQEIMDLYTHKTGRYSFSLPLMAGAMLAGQDEAGLAALSRLGELMGMVFQIRDDELGLFGSESELGKPVGSDIREGKKTIFYRTLLDSLPPGEILAVMSRFGATNAGLEEVQAIRELMESTGARRQVQEQAGFMRMEAADLIDQLPVDERHRRTLSGLLDFISTREL
jgi:geranylgeranyl diphosphate synthase type I